MPRTRTKFIWPPSNSNMAAPDESAAPGTSEPRPKRPRVSSHFSTDGQAVSHETTPGSSEGSLQAQFSKRSPPRELAAPALVPRVEYNPLAKSPIEQIRSYQRWRNQGSEHDDFCYACRQRMSQLTSLKPCHTCRVSFHDKCIPAGSTYDQRNNWFCPTCVRRNWHVEPPTMTPPASPPLGPHDAQSTPSLQEQRSERLSAPSGRDSPGSGAADHGGQQALSILAEISRSMSRGSPSRSVADAASVNATVSHPAVASPPQLNRTVSTSRRTNSSNMPSPTPSSAQKFSLLDSHARKSRFATLSSEVDSALWVLYRELESATSLRQHITDLEAEIVKLRQDVSIRDNQLILSQRVAQAGRPPQSEVDRLKALVAKNESAVREAEELRAKNQALELELKKAKDEVASMNETLKEWKGKLINMIGS